MSVLAEIIERRARLVAEADAQRHALAEGFAGCRSVLVVADRGIAWATWLRARPYLVVAFVTAIAVLRPRLALEWSAAANTSEPRTVQRHAMGQSLLPITTQEMKAHCKRTAGVARSHDARLLPAPVESSGAAVGTGGH